MEKQQAINEIRNRWRDLYQADRNGGIICPICGSGNGTHGTGITENKAKPGQLKCWQCDFQGDIIDLIEKEKNIEFYPAVQEAARRLNIVIENERSRGAVNERSGKRENIQAERESPAEAAEMPDLTEYYIQCNKRINDPAAASYLQARGISKELQERYLIGFDPKADPAKTGYTTPRIIIPITFGHYIARSIDSKTPKEYCKLNNKGATIGIFNEAAISAGNAENIFVVEGVFDALSIIEAGGEAIALNSTSNCRLLLKGLEKEPTDKTLLICLDNDKAGKRAAQELTAGLERLNIRYTAADLNGGHKDPNEYLQADRAGFIKAVAAAEQKTAARPDNTSRYIDLIMSGDIERFREGAARKTGFSNLDEKTGGLYSGLYCIAATSSLGKTTFSLQLADNLAAAGSNILFFSLEQSRLELVSKSLARITAQNDIKTAVTSLQIRRGYLPEQVLQAAEDYKIAVEERMNIIEGNFNCNIEYIRNYTRDYIKRTGETPVIFVDYLQILQGEPSKHQTTKEQVDLTVTELKRLSRELNTAVFIISSVNRAGYLLPIDFESIKESGNIEFTCDVIWGLQLECLNDPLFEAKEKLKEKREMIKAEKAKPQRQIELSCLKNRYGISNYSCYFEYYPQYDLYIPKQATNTDPNGSEPEKSGRRI